LAAALKQSTSVSNGWLAARLGMGQPASAAIANLLSRVKT
jgi:hypothetical protein